MDIGVWWMADCNMDVEVCSGCSVVQGVCSVVQGVCSGCSVVRGVCSV